MHTLYNTTVWRYVDLQIVLVVVNRRQSSLLKLRLLCYTL